ncbi:polysaccharide pyruvyl transferase family protein [Duganella fentianensis]|uniref:polysaccharide pyruvyl transferase family protein n=1 Tax=Duganella fentianensis TaxID=2692177 RepID=UPI0032B2528A
MTTTIYFTGQNNFGNRGCEALVRSSVATLRAQIPDAHFLVPSLDPERDSAQWPDAAAQGIEFVPSPALPSSFKWRGRLCRRLPWLKVLAWPSLAGRADLEPYLKRADLVVSIGGDNISLDYGLESLFMFVGVAERAIELGKRVALWGASVGPFSSDARVERQLSVHLRKLDMVSIRESHSLAYLKSIGVEANVVAVADSAFALDRIEVDVAPFWPIQGSEGVLGLNVSPLIEKTYARSGRSGTVAQETVAFIEWVLANTSMSVLLVPHVVPLDGASGNNDEIYLDAIRQQVLNGGERVKIAPAGLNACELKDIIARCTLFIGARTHATIAALSTCVPTVSIAYSVKARGLNRDLFGHERYVLPTQNVSALTLQQNLLMLQSEQGVIRAVLKEKMPEWKDKARLSAQVLAKELAHS